MYFHSSALATGMIKKGVISIVRTTPRPTNSRSSSRASPRPSRVEMITHPAVSSTVFSSACRNTVSLNTAA